MHFQYVHQTVLQLPSKHGLQGLIAVQGREVRKVWFTSALGSTGILIQDNWQWSITAPVCCATIIGDTIITLIPTDNTATGKLQLGFPSHKRCQCLHVNSYLTPSWYRLQMRVTMVFFLERNW